MAFVPNATGFVNSIAVQSDGKILAGGSFTSIGGQSRSLFARLLNDTAALSNLAVTASTVTLTRDGSAPQFARVTFEQSNDNGATWNFLGNATPNFTNGLVGADTPVRMSAKHEGYLAGGIGDGDKSVLAPNVGAPLASGYTLTGIQLIDGNTLVRARGFARSGHQNGSESIEDKVQSVFLMGPTAANVSVSGRVLTLNGNGVRNVIVTLTDNQGITRRVNTSSFGYYSFDDVTVGETYIINPSSKRFQFAPQVVTVSDELTDVDFIASP